MGGGCQRLGPGMFPSPHSALTPPLHTHLHLYVCGGGCRGACVHAHTIYERCRGGVASAWKWTVYRKKEVKDLLGYFAIHPLRSPKKQMRIELIKKYFELRANKAHLALRIQN